MNLKLKKHSLIVNEWFQVLINEVKPGQELWIPCENKSHQMSLKTQFYKRKKEFEYENPVEASKITFTPTTKADEVTKTFFWLVAIKRNNDPTIAYIKRSKDSVPEIVRINPVVENSTKEENLKLMAKDRLSVEEVKTIYELTEEEEAFYLSLIEDQDKLLPLVEKGDKNGIN